MLGPGNHTHSNLVWALHERNKLDIYTYEYRVSYIGCRTHRSHCLYSHRLTVHAWYVLYTTGLYNHHSVYIIYLLYYIYIMVRKSRLINNEIINKINVNVIVRAHCPCSRQEPPTSLERREHWLKKYYSISYMQLNLWISASPYTMMMRIVLSHYIYISCHWNTLIRTIRELMFITSPVYVLISNILYNN